MKTQRAPREYRAGKHRLSFSHALVMGIINATPDSFSDGGRFDTVDNAVRRADVLVEEGAEIIDVGGESTRPGAESVSADEETRRVVPVIREIVRRHPSVPVSIDSRKPEVTLAALEEGAVIINDICGLRDPGMVDLAVKWKTPVVIMHMKGTPKTMQRRPSYKDVVEDIISFFKERIGAVSQRGVKKIILDPGIGFGKTVRHNLQILNRLDEIADIGYPVLVGASRKSFIGEILNEPVDQREAGTIAVTALAVSKGASIIRVHNARENLQAARVAESIRRAS